MNARLRGRAMLGASAAGWALYTPAAKYALAGGFTPLGLITIQLAIAAIALGAVVWRRGPGPMPPLRHTLLRALLEPAGNVSLFLLGLAHVAAAQGSLLLAIEGLITAVLAAAVLRERLPAAAWCGVLAAVPGLWLLLGAPTSLTVSFASVMIMSGVCCSAGYAVLTAQGMRRRGVDVVTATAVQMALALAVFAPLAMAGAVTQPSMATPSASAWGVAVASGLLLAGPTLLYNGALTHVPVGESALIFNIVPVLGAGLGVLLLGETLTMMQMIGGVVVLADVALATGRAPRDQDEIRGETGAQSTTMISSAR